MTRNAGYVLAFAATVAAAAAAAVLVSSSAVADDINPAQGLNGVTTAAAVPLLHQMSADALKSGYLMCERALTKTVLNFDEFTVCSALYEELRGRVFAGDLDALITWLRQAWSEGAQPR